jgi:DNA-binding GntR family transcriptional regulator
MDEISHAGLASRLYEELTQAILKGDLSPGEKLSEPALARQFGASRAPVREAIRRLQERGLVTYVVNQGARVSRTSFWLCSMFARRWRAWRLALPPLT